MFDDDFDPEFHSPEEVEAHDAEERQIAELAQFFTTLSRDEEAIKRLADEDPIGYALCGQPVEDFGWSAEQADAWLESRLSGEDSHLPGESGE